MGNDYATSTGNPYMDAQTPASTGINAGMPDLPPATPPAGGATNDNAVGAGTDGSTVVAKFEGCCMNCGCMTRSAKKFSKNDRCPKCGSKDFVFAKIDKKADALAVCSYCGEWIDDEDEWGEGEAGYWHAECHEDFSSKHYEGRRKKAGYDEMDNLICDNCGEEMDDFENGAPIGADYDVHEDCLMEFLSFGGRAAFGSRKTAVWADYEGSVGFTSLYCDACHERGNSDGSDNGNERMDIEDILDLQDYGLVPLCDGCGELLYTIDEWDAAGGLTARRMFSNKKARLQRLYREGRLSLTQFHAAADDEEDAKDGEDENPTTQDPEATSGPDGGPPVGEPEPPTEELGADPNNPTKEAPAEAPETAPVAPEGEQVAPVGTDPMDRAQATLEAQVDAVNQLGHDAMEVSYDVDELFSEWRCMNCEQEGRADISEDGQVAFSGDLLEAPQGCTAPQIGVGEVAPAVPTDPNQQAPETNDQIPAQDQGITDVQGKRRYHLRWPFRREAVEWVETKETKINKLTKAILSTNPGMNEAAARKVATATVSKFPSVAKG